MASQCSSTAQAFANQGYAYAGSIAINDSVNDFIDSFSQVILRPDELFLAEPDAKRANATRANPESTGFNIADLLFQEDPVNQLGLLSEALGNFSVISRKIVCDLPTCCLPKYIRDLNEKTPNANLTYLVKPFYRFMTYFWGIDFHQDLIDHGYKSNNYVTLYIHLTPASAIGGCLIVLPETHRLGADLFPHEIVSNQNNSLVVRSRLHQSAQVETKAVKLTGAAGSSFFWHNALLHGTGTNQEIWPRFTLRYVVCPTSDNSCVGDANRGIIYPLELGSTRTDLDPLGKPLIKGNFIKEVLEAL